MNNTLRVLIAYVICLVIGQGAAIGLGLFADRYSAAAGISVFIPTYYAMYWVAWRAALLIGDRSPEPATGSSGDSGGSPLKAAMWLLLPATVVAELCD